RAEFLPEILDALTIPPLVRLIRDRLVPCGLRCFAGLVAIGGPRKIRKDGDELVRLDRFRQKPLKARGEDRSPILLAAAPRTGDGGYLVSRALLLPNLQNERNPVPSGHGDVAE